MKTLIFGIASAGLALALLPLTGAEPQAETNSVATVSTVSTNNAVSVADDAGVTNSVAAEEAERKLESAPGSIVSAPAAAPGNVKLSSTATEVVKLAQAGVDESVMLSYVTNSPYFFKLSSDDIIYLNDIGVPSAVVTGMLQRDQLLNNASSTAVAAAPPVDTNQQVPSPGAPTPYPIQESAVTQAPPQEIAEDPQPQEVNGSSTYFYDSLAPYGSWVNINGYGMCWQPTVVVANPAWQPYCDRGHWVYSNCGWYWASDYSWGWAPFHYGRWFCHNNLGWCWAPDTTWGPSWVTWRSSNAYCGWAPLPPTACYRPGGGFTFYGQFAAGNCGFGLSAARFTFVSTSHFCDPHPGFHRLPRGQAQTVFNTTVAVNQFSDAGDHHRPFNHGIAVDKIKVATHQDLRPVRIQDTDRPMRPSNFGQSQQPGRTISTYRPTLPSAPNRGLMVGEGVQPAPHDPSTRNRRVSPGMNQHIDRPVVGTGPINSQPTVRNNPSPGRPDRPTRPDNSTTANAARPVRTAPLTVPDADSQLGTATPRTSNPMGANNANRSARYNPPAPVTTTTAPIQNDPAPGNRNHRPTTTFVVPQPQPSAPAPNQFPAQNPGHYRVENPRNRQPNPGWNPPAAPVQTQPVMPTYQTPRAAEAQPRFGGNPSYNQGAPAYRPQAPASRVETYQAPPQMAPPAPSVPSAPPQAPQARGGFQPPVNNGNNNQQQQWQQRPGK